MLAEVSNCLVPDSYMWIFVGFFRCWTVGWTYNTPDDITFSSGTL